jgi:hypothetical protein
LVSEPESDPQHNTAEQGGNQTRRSGRGAPGKDVGESGHIEIKRRLLGKRQSAEMGSYVISAAVNFPGDFRDPRFIRPPQIRVENVYQHGQQDG